MLLGETIRNRRQELGLSQSKVEKMSGIKREYLSKIENSEHKNPTLLTIEKVAKVLDMEAWELLKAMTGPSISDIQEQQKKREERLREVKEKLSTAVELLNAQGVTIIKLITQKEVMIKRMAE